MVVGTGRKVCIYASAMGPTSSVGHLARYALVWFDCSILSDQILRLSSFDAGRCGNVGMFSLITNADSAAHNASGTSP